MPTGFNARKAAQVIAYLASKTSTKRLNVLKAVKLAYLGDRLSLERYGFPIIDDDRYSLPNGPVNSITYSFIQGEYEDAGWKEYLRDRSNHELSAKPSSIGNWDELSDAELGCLDAVWAKFGHMDQWELVRWTHNKKNVPEWEDPNGSSAPIPVSRILEMLKVENAEDVASQIEDFRAIDRVFHTLRK